MVIRRMRCKDLEKGCLLSDVSLISIYQKAVQETLEDAQRYNKTEDLNLR